MTLTKLSPSPPPMFTQDKDYIASRTKAEGRYADLEIETKVHEGLFSLINAVVEKHEDLGAEDRRLLERYHRDVIRHGLGLENQQRKELEITQKRLVRQINEYEKNLREDNDGIWFLAEDLTSVSEGMIAGLKRGADVNEGKVQLTFSFPDRFTTLKYAKNSETRRHYYIAFENRCSANVAIFKEILVLRQEAAQLLGYDTRTSMP
ncbi:zincin [Aureobasidium namibiae CBS 147.97]|uniref:Zincin n=1 Tax=Aureobasidium namibiae CBS 147.97 TaxID=1043004 RepID=A0A074WG65_9PEZI